MSLYVSSTQMVLDNWVVAVVCLFEHFLVSNSAFWLLGKHSTADLNPQSLIPLFSDKLFTY